MSLFLFYQKEVIIIYNESKYDYEVVKIIPKYRINNSNLTNFNETNCSKQTLNYINNLISKKSPLRPIEEYITIKIPIKHRCNLCGNIIAISPKNALRRMGCENCMPEKYSGKPAKYTKELFLLELKQKRPNVLLIGEYIDFRTKTLFKYLDCGHEGLYRPSNVLYETANCNICKTQKLREINLLSKEEYTNKLSYVNPNIVLIGEYLGIKKKTPHKCLKHNYIWDTTPASVLHEDVGCPICRKEKVKEKVLMRAKPLEQYKKELQDNCPTVIVISGYKNISTNCLHKCLVCDYEWLTKPARMLQKGIMFGCPKCADRYHAQQKSMGIDKYRQRLQEVNSNIICLDKEYINNSTKLRHKCLICDYVWEAIPSNILKGHGCPICAKILISAANLKTHEEFIEDFKRLNPFKDQIKILGTYIKSHEHIECQCLVCNGIWKIIPSNLLKGYGCPYCHSSEGEKMIKMILDEYKIKYIQQKSFDGLVSDNKYPLTYDFYLPDYNKLIERQGQQHERPVEFFGGEKAFKKQQEHDRRKREYAKQHNIDLLEIWYYEIDKTEEILINNLNLKSVTTAECA